MRDGNIVVLVVEDNLGDLRLIQRRLKSANNGVHFEIVHASSLKASLEQSGDGVDVVLLDLDLPDSFQLDTLRKLRARNAAVPIIVLTGLQNRDKAKEALAIGAQDYLVKDEIDGVLLEKAIMRQVQKHCE